MRRKMMLISILLLLTSTWFAIQSFSSINHDPLGEVNSTIIVREQYATIQAAIDNAEQGDTISVQPGKYVECLTIDKSLKLIGSGNSTVIENSGSLNTITISPGTTGVTLEGFYVNSSGSFTGIYVRSNIDNVIKGNIIANHRIGIHIYDSSKITLKNNLMVKNRHNLRVWGLSPSHFLHDIDTSNLVDGRPVYYWINQHNKTVPLDAGYVAIVNSANIVVANLNLSHNLSGVLLAYANNSIVVNVTASMNERGLYMVCSHNNDVVNNNFFWNEWCGISTISSTNNFIAGNTLSNSEFGVRLSHSFPLIPYYSDNNVVGGNTVEECTDGVYLEASSHNQVSGNIIMHNKRYGIVLDESDGNTVYRNTVEGNECGVWNYHSNNNTLYYNNFVNNTAQVKVSGFSPSVNVWDNGYPSGGNYWSDYNGTDLYHGPSQNITGGDGIGDASYIFDSGNKDRYPLLYSPSKNNAPTAKFTFYPVDIRVKETTHFIDESVDDDGRIVLCLWNFGADCFSRDANVSMSFEREGNYTVVLSVFDDEGSGENCTKNVFVRRFFSYLFLSVPNYAAAGKEIEISATLLSEEGNGLSDSTISFYSVGGNVSELIGSSITNSSGVATIWYKPVEAGDFKIKALYPSSSLYTDSVDFQSLTVTEERPYLSLILGSALILAILVVGIKIVFRKRRGDKA